MPVGLSRTERVLERLRAPVWYQWAQINDLGTSQLELHAFHLLVKSSASISHDQVYYNTIWQRCSTSFTKEVYHWWVSFVLHTAQEILREGGDSLRRCPASAWQLWHGFDTFDWQFRADPLPPGSFCWIHLSCGAWMYWLAGSAVLHVAPLLLSQKMLKCCPAVSSMLESQTMVRTSRTSWGVRYSTYTQIWDCWADDRTLENIIKLTFR